MYKNGVADSKWTKWTITAGDPSAYGEQYATIAAADYDTTAEYKVTYIALDKYGLTCNAVDVTGEYNANPKMVQDQLVRRVADIETTSSVLVNSVAELYKRIKALGG